MKSGVDAQVPCGPQLQKTGPAQVWESTRRRLKHFGGCRGGAKAVSHNRLLGSQVVQRVVFLIDVYSPAFSGCAAAGLDI